MRVLDKSLFMREKKRLPMYQSGFQYDLIVIAILQMIRKSEGAFKFKDCAVVILLQIQNI